MSIKMCFENGKKKAFTLSYDDGGVYDIPLIEIFNKHNLKSTFFVCSSRLEIGNFNLEKEEGSISYEKAKTLYEGHEIASHSVNHARVGEIERSAVEYEVKEDIRAIKENLGIDIKGFAYPCGSQSDEAIEVIKEAGLSYARTNKSTYNFDLPTDWYQWSFTCRHGDERLMECAREFVSLNPETSKIFYVFGHSYEFARNRAWDKIDKWHIMEELADFMGGRDDIWYATNGEIYDYISAFNSLEIADDSIYNPSKQKVFFELNGKVLSVDANETINV